MYPGIYFKGREGGEMGREDQEMCPCVSGIILQRREREGGKAREL